MATLSETLRHIMAGKIGAQKLGHLTGIPKTTIDSWLAGTGRRPRDWRSLLSIAQVLLLSRTEVDALLAAAGHVPVAELARRLGRDHPDRACLRRWLDPDEAVPMRHDSAAPHQPDPQVQGSAGTTVPWRHQLRAPARDFVGRTAEVLRLREALRVACSSGGVAAIGGVYGMGGIGKTELSYQIAHGLIDAFPDAQIVVDLRGSHTVPLTAAQALQTVVHALAPNMPLPDTPQALERLYRSVLHGQRALILADDARDAAQVRPLLPPAGGGLLITSRQRFSLPGMVTVDLEQLSDADATALLLGICTRLNLSEAQTIARACGHLPLALRVSGSILHNDCALPVTSYIERLRDQRQRLAHLRDPDDPQLDVAASLALSYAQLDAAAQLVFRQLGVFVAGFATPLALMVVAAPEGVDVEATLRLLLRRNLIMYSAGQSCWRLHDLVRDFAQSLLTDAGEREAVGCRYARAAVDLARATQDHYLTGGDATVVALARFDAERPHIDTARRWAAAHAETAAGDALLVADAIATYEIGDLRYDRRGEILPQLATALSAARRVGDRRGEGAVLNRLGVTYLALGDAGCAMKYYEQRLTIMREFGDRRGEGQALNNLGRAYRQLGDVRRAIIYFEQRLTIAREIKDARGEGNTLCNLGLAYLSLGDVLRALAHLEPALARFQALGIWDGEAAVLGGLGRVYLALGDARRAIASMDQALAIFRRLGSRHDEATTLIELGRVYLTLGNTQRAIDTCTCARSLLQEAGDQYGEGSALRVLGASYTILGDWASARTMFEVALIRFRTAGDRWGEAECQWQFGLALAQQGERGRALPLLRAAVAYEQEIGHTRATEDAALLIRLEAGEDLPAELPAHAVIGVRSTPE